jgi:hypothetical protein
MSRFIMTMIDAGATRRIFLSLFESEIRVYSCVVLTVKDRPANLA